MATREPADSTPPRGRRANETDRSAPEFSSESSRVGGVSLQASRSFYTFVSPKKNSTWGISVLSIYTYTPIPLFRLLYNSASAVVCAARCRRRRRLHRANNTAPRFSLL